MGIVVVESPTLGEGWLAVSRAILEDGALAGALVVHAKSAHVYEPEWSVMALIVGAGQGSGRCRRPWQDASTGEAGPGGGQPATLR
jgi:hypothetical protein